MAATTTEPNNDKTSSSTTSLSNSSSSPAAAGGGRPGTAGRIDYDKWHKVTNELVEDVEAQDLEETIEQKKALGLDGKYAQSADHAEERNKAKQVRKAKRVLDDYQKRESRLKESLVGLLGPVVAVNTDDNGKGKEESKSKDSSKQKIVRITRDMIDAGKRVVSVMDTSGRSSLHNDIIVMTSDLSLLESKMKANAMNQMVKPKSYPDDAQNDVPEEEKEESKGEEEKHRSVFGVIKGFISNVHNCTILIKCKFISGSIELSHCSNLIIRIEKDAMVATIQADLCKNITIEFNDAPSGKNNPNAGPNNKLYWGDDKEDRIFHAGVSKMNVKLIRDGYVEYERLCDYEADGATTVGNASPEEYQFITSVVDDNLITEAVVREGATTGENARAMTKRELEESRKKKEQAAKVAVGMAENMIKFKEKDHDGQSKVTKIDDTTSEQNEEGKQQQQQQQEKKEEEEEEIIEEVYGSMGKQEIDTIVAECEKNKSRGNEAFGAGEYAQAILLYSLALDKASELPDFTTNSESQQQLQQQAKQQLFPRDIVLSNRAACFLKLGQHEKAEEDARNAKNINPKNVKAYFRQGLALHAQGQYQDARQVLGEAHKLEPKNRQIKEALQFAEVRFEQEMRKRMQG